MRRPLTRHPDSPFLDVQVEIELARPRAHWLTLSYILTGNIAGIFLPPVIACERKDDLWRRTCFEAFARTSGPEYYEFHFAPSSQWAVYRFDNYRAGKSLPEITPPVIEIEAGQDRFELRASLELGRLSGLSTHASWQFGLSALIEDKAGNLSYWALAHPPGKRDFHHPDGFALELSPVD